METRPSTSPDQVSDLPDDPDQNDRNAFVFGFTPQAELWNGRLAMLGFTIFLILNVMNHILGS